ncbi:hypothetical protein YC2023_064432 [Brassica napus]
MVRQQRASTVHEDRYHRGKDELVKRDMLDPPRRTQDIRGKALSFWCFGLETVDSTSQGTEGAWCSYDTDPMEASTSSLELDLATGVVKRLELDSKPQAASKFLSSKHEKDA